MWSSIFYLGIETTIHLYGSAAAFGAAIVFAAADCFRPRLLLAGESLVSGRPYFWTCLTQQLFRSGMELDMTHSTAHTLVSGLTISLMTLYFLSGRDEYYGYGAMETLSINVYEEVPVLMEPQFRLKQGGNTHAFNAV